VSEPDDRSKHAPSDTALPSGPAHPVGRSYVIATSPRTGSTLLSEAMSSIGHAGQPDEYFDLVPRHQQYWKERFAIAESDCYLDRVVEASRSANGMFGFKLHWHQLPTLRTRLIESIPSPEEPDHRDVLDLLRQRFPGIRFVWLRRRNKVAQAISYYRAAKSTVWRSWNDQRRPRNEHPAEVVYDRAAISNFLRSVREMDESWRRVFMARKIPALVVLYEDFVERYEPTVRGIARFLGLPADEVIVPPPALIRMADAVSAEWEQRFRAEYAGGPAFVPRAGVPAESRGTATISTRTARSAAPGQGQRQGPARLTLTAFDVGLGSKADLTEGNATHAWMAPTPNRVVGHSPPMIVANPWGWLLRMPSRVVVTWDGTANVSGLVVETPAGEPSIAASHSGSGVVTFHVGYLFRAPPDYNLLVRGPPNWPKDGICALEDLIEADRMDTDFTVSWVVTRPDHPVAFEAGEPFAMIVPVRRGERFDPVIRRLESDPDLMARYNARSATGGRVSADLDASRQGPRAGDPPHNAAGGNSAPRRPAGSS